ncbi:hypothetical protein EYC84_005459 [Monilinia fructicola]|uniref:Myb/SANT-like DNA-binding domain-containing protein n=1 Tax=Monilinia fructicola TaxID=38448 RepID=A0A5M9JWI9_MONFR|nr:hypothetical protein EYC84_005459 [Monilinia fructicola]
MYSMKRKIALSEIVQGSRRVAYQRVRNGCTTTTTTINLGMISLPVLGDLTMEPEIEPQRERAKRPDRWTREEVSKMLEIVGNLKSDQADSKTGKLPGDLWFKVSDEMKSQGFNRQPSAVVSKLHRDKAKWKPESRGKSSSSSHMSGIDSFKKEDEEKMMLSYHGKKETFGQKKRMPLHWSASRASEIERENSSSNRPQLLEFGAWFQTVFVPVDSTGNYTNVCRYWMTKGRKKHNFDARTPTSIERASREMIQAPKTQLKQTPSKLATSTDGPPSSVPRSSTEKSLQSRSGIDNRELSTRNHQKYRGGKSLPPLFLTIRSFGGVGLKRGASNSSVQSEIEEKPAKKVRYVMGPRDVMGVNGTSIDMIAQDEASASNYRSPKSFSKSPTQRDTPNKPPQLAIILAEEREAVQQKILAADEARKRLKLAIDAYKETAAEEYRQKQLAISTHDQRAEAALEAAKEREKELAGQEETHKKARERLEKIQSLLDD